LDGQVLYVNAALVPELKLLPRLVELVRKGEPFLAVNDQRVAAALCREPFPERLLDRPPTDLVGYLLDQRFPVVDDEFAMLNAWYDVIGAHERLLKGHLEYLIDRRKPPKFADGVYALDGLKVAPNVVFDPEQGPIVLGRNVRIQPFGLISGPVRIGDHCLVTDHAAIKHGTVLGSTVKAGGEIEASVVESYSNKQHHGFLGHAYVGSWVNLGAGTSNSDLKNTYGEISVELEGEMRPTGRMFLGCVIGDYTKTAINTSIFTGKLLGVASFVYGFVTTNVPSFSNYARSFGQVTEVSVDVAVKTQSRAAKRRNVETTEVDVALMQDLYGLTQSERQLASEQVSL
ncbi:MAG: putative sugar nucleotidyl transferase, partial [Planctomycetia bacterium]